MSFRAPCGYDRKRKGDLEEEFPEFAAGLENLATRPRELVCKRMRLHGEPQGALRMQTSR